MTVDPAPVGGVKLSLVLPLVRETLPEPDVMDAELMVAPVGAYANVDAAESNGLIVDAVPATAVLVRGQAASGVSETSSK